MKKTTREFIDCKECNGRGWFLEKAFPVDQVRCSSKCQYCNGEGRILIKETIQESDDMKEFIEKKCGWELVEEKPSTITAKEQLAQSGNSLELQKILEENARKTRNTTHPDYCCTGCPCGKPLRCLVNHF